MYVVKVEIFYKDGLRSICINHREMEGTAILEDKPVEKWFCPITGRASWKGLQEEIAEQDESGRMEKTYCFIFHGPEELRQQFRKNISDSKMGRMAELSEIEKTAQEYMEIAEQQEAIGDSRGAMQAYCIAADWYHLARAEFVYGNYCANTLCDMDAAARYYGRAAQQGYADAQYRYGKCLENGTGVPKNAGEAVIWYQKAAAQGQEDASQELEQRKRAREEAQKRLDEERRKEKEKKQHEELEREREKTEKIIQECEKTLKQTTTSKIKTEKKPSKVDKALDKVIDISSDILYAPVKTESLSDGIMAGAVKCAAAAVIGTATIIKNVRTPLPFDQDRYNFDNELDESDKAQS